MEGANQSRPTAQFIHQQAYQVQFTGGPLTKTVVCILLSLFFVYVNVVMLTALLRRAAFTETPRYILFAHMLCNDSIQLLSSIILYMFLLVFIQVSKALCSFLIFISSTTFYNAPLNVALMSLERYIAVCCPLRHRQIATPTRTALAIALMWLISSITIVIDILFPLATDPESFMSPMFCFREGLLIAQWQADIFKVFNAICFVSVTVIILFNYISIMVTARSVSSDKESAKKAQRTVLLHLLQLGLCLTSFLYAAIESLLALAGSSRLFMDLRYLNFLIVLIVPRCLSPLIYGLRDNAVRPLFRYYFCCGSAGSKTAVWVH